VARASAAHYWTTIVPVMASPWTAQSYWYVPGVVKVNVYVWPLPVILRGAGPAGLPTGEVGERMVVSREPDVTRLLIRMEKQGLVERERRADNQRFVTARITRKGLRLLKALDEPVRRMHARQLVVGLPERLSAQ
jgi:hypothetical protein